MSRFSHRQKLHIHPDGEYIPSQRSSKLFQSIDEERANLQLWTNLETQFGTHGICQSISWDYKKGFDNLKERLNFRRMQVSSELSLNGKLFIEFIALIYLSYVKKRMQDAGLFEKWSLQGLIDELDLIELFEAPGMVECLVKSLKS